jgi:CRISPR/Cas system Type II protein with McrA/HNH and RuvC-like nuclease domain
MPTMPIARVKNMIGRALRGVVDPEPTGKQISSLWEYFDSKCAYCGREVQKKNKSAHIDHLTPTSKKGMNHISNRVLSCASCNEQEKKEMDWEPFLRQKNPDNAEFETRKNRILDWQKKQGGPTALTEEKGRALADSTRAVHDALDTQVRELRK